MNHEPSTIDSAGDLAVRIAHRAENLYLTRQLLCSEAVLVVLNETFNGGLTRDQAIRLASGLPIGLGESGCLCGALSGGVLALGLFLTPDRPSAGDRKKARQAAAELHNRFKLKFKSTCCRVLTKKIKDNKEDHFRQCSGLTGTVAELTTILILEKRPKLIDCANLNYLDKHDTVLSAMAKRLTGRM